MEWPGPVQLRQQLLRALDRFCLIGPAEESRQLATHSCMGLRHLMVGAALVLGIANGPGWSESLIAVLGFTQAVTHVWSVRVPRQAGLVAVLDTWIFLVLTVLGLPPLLMLLVSVAILGWAGRFRPVPAIASYAAVLGAIGIRYERADDLTSSGVTAAFCLLGGIHLLRTVQLTMGVRRAAERERLVSERFDAILWELVPGTDTVKVSPSAERVLGHQMAAWNVPGFWRSLVNPEDLAPGQEPGDVWSQAGHAVFRMRHADGSWRWVENRTSAVPDRRRRQTFFAGVLLDVTERVEATHSLHVQARHDDLTGLPNRRGLQEILRDHLALARNEPTALLVLDLDSFKEINDSLGHDTGDQILCCVGERILACARPGETVARLGGDEFAVLVPGGSPSVAAERGRQVAEAINDPLELGDLRLRVRASVGIAVHPTDASGTQELIRRADIAMYQAKDTGGDPRHYDAVSDPFSTERVTLASDLETAITSSHLLLHHQPLVDVVTGTVIGTEALVRWLHPTFGMILPLRFIELAEISGQMKDLTRWVVRQALTELQQLGQTGSRLEVSVNLSVRNLYEPDFIAWLTAVLAECGMSGERLVVEITESTVMVDHAAAVETIQALHELGVRTWIDDFGTGYSSLARLRNLPVDGVKIDRAFVTGAVDFPKDRAVLRSLIELVSSLGLQTVAEGVERPECFQLLQSLGCDLAQGYHLARPMPIAALPGVLGPSLYAPSSGIVRPRSPLDPTGAAPSAQR